MQVGTMQVGAMQVGTEMRDVVVGAAGIDDKLQLAIESRDHQIVENTAILIEE